MTSDAAMNSERRVAGRHKVLGSAVISYAGDNCAMECVVLDRSASGARIRPVDPMVCPDDFILVGRDGERFICRIVWRRGELVGVRFV